MTPPARSWALAPAAEIDSARLVVGAIDAAAMGPFKKCASGHARTRKREKCSLFGCDFSGW